jgi:V8-like Glu-specific endopeptidase
MFGLPTSRFIAVVFGSLCSLGVPLLPNPNVPQNRQTKPAAITPPLNNVCRLEVKRKKLTSSPTDFSSGAYIGGGLILTAAHNLHSTFTTEVNGVSVECGVLQHQDGAGRLEGFTKAMVAEPKDYGFGCLGEDTALLRFPDTSASAFEIAPDDLTLSVGQEVHLGGFPGTGYSVNGNDLYSSTGTILAVTDVFVRYGISTVTGNSGGPVWIDVDGRHILVGVHIAGDGKNDGTARRVSVSRVAQLKQRLQP